MKKLYVYPSIISICLLNFIIILLFDTNLIVINLGNSEQKGLFYSTTDLHNARDTTYILFKNPRLDLNRSPRVLKHLVKKNESGYWVRGTHPLSLDSRYFGYLDHKQIIGFYKLLISL